MDEQDTVWDPEYPLPAIAAPGRPDRPELVPPARVPRRRLGSEQGRAALVHAIAHIEFNAINLALDAAYRFRDMPRQYHLDWVSVAADEARHFRLLDSGCRTWDMLTVIFLRTTACGKWRRRRLEAA